MTRGSVDVEGFRRFHSTLASRHVLETRPPSGQRLSSRLYITTSIVFPTPLAAANLFEILFFTGLFILTSDIIYTGPTMSDATLPPPRSSSADPATEDGNRSDSSNGEAESDTSLIESTDTSSKEETGGGKPDNKQKRKRTRYAFYFSAIPESLCSLYLYNMCVGCLTVV